MNCHADRNALERLVEKITENANGELMINSLEAELLMEHSEEIEPFCNVTSLNATSGRDYPRWKDLRFLELFPNIKFLGIREFDRPDIDEAKPMSFDGIQNCPNLEEVCSYNLTVPPVLAGIEFCTKLRIFFVWFICDGESPMDITPLSDLSCLGHISIHSHDTDRGALVETEGLDLSRCKSLKCLNIRPTSKDLRFLGSVQLDTLYVPYSELESLEGLDTTRLRQVDLRYNRITCIGLLRGAKLRNRTSHEYLEGNPIDPAVLDKIVNSWV